MSKLLLALLITVSITAHAQDNSVIASTKRLCDLESSLAADFYKLKKAKQPLIKTIQNLKKEDYDVALVVAMSAYDATSEKEASSKAYAACVERNAP